MIGQGWCGAGRTWHHRRTLRPAVTGDVRSELWTARSGRPLPTRAVAAREGKDVGHKIGVWRARGEENRGPGHETGGKCARRDGCLAGLAVPGAKWGLNAPGWREKLFLGANGGSGAPGGENGYGPLPTRAVAARDGAGGIRRKVCAGSCCARPVGQGLALKPRIAQSGQILRWRSG